MKISDALVRLAPALALVLSYTLWPGLGWAQGAVGVLGAYPENSTPVYTALGMAPKVLLTLSRDHTLAYAAYNDFSDIDGDGILDYRFKPGFEYLGLFNSYYCYSYATTSGKGLYSPVAKAIATTDANGKTVPGACVGAGTTSLTWSGNFLNYVTTSRIDALRVALYGGYREVDNGPTGTPSNQTILRRAYIPQDGHAWAKEYTGTAIDGYDISRYAPLAQPTAGTHHFFGNLTSTVQDGVFHMGTDGKNYPDPGLSCATLSTCSDKPPLLRIIVNSPSRVWQWASSERPVLNAIADPNAVYNAIHPIAFAMWIGYGTGTLTDYHVRVEACTSTYHDGCKLYVTSYKPVGVLQDFGDNGSIDFGLLTGSYDNNMAGGRLRKNIGPFAGTDGAAEVDLTNGTFKRFAYSIIDQIDKIRIRNFNNLDRVFQEPDYFNNNFIYKNRWDETAKLMTEGTYGDWGSPVAEMMYEGLRYLSNQGAATGAYTSKGATEDLTVGLQAPAWKQPYTTDNWCAKPNQYVIASVNPSFDSDQLPGSAFGNLAPPLKDLNNTAIDAKTLADAIGTTEGVAGKTVFIGETSANADGSPTAKPITNLGSIRGLIPDDTNKQGSYYAAAVAHFGKKGNLLQFGTNTVPSVDTFALMLNSPVPKISVPFGTQTISIMPFSRTVGDVRGNAQAFAAINQYVGVYIEQLDDPKNTTGNFYIKFHVNYEDASWGSDHEMDALVQYEVKANNGKLTVTVTPEYQGGDAIQNMGYVVDGSTQDGPYLVVQDQRFDQSYPLNVPDGAQYQAGACNMANPPAACAALPNIANDGNHGTSSTRGFSPSTGASGNIFLKDPLWYAAQWGGYPDGSPPTAATTADPINYAKVTSPASLKQAFANAFNNILQRSNQAAGVSASTQQLQTDTQIFTGEFNAKYFSGDLVARKIDPNIGATGIQFTANWKASDTMPVPASRNIYFNQSGAATALTTGNVAAFMSSDELDYVRGVRTKELQNGGTFRNRQTGLLGGSILGSVINSAPVYSDDTKTVYVAANDGMLHGFKAADGTEVFSYMPSAVTGYIANLANPSNARRYYLDGNISVSKKSKTGVTYLAGFMGRAAKGVYGLAVDANGIKTGATLWEFGTTGDADMGYVVGLGLIEKLKDGTDVLIFGNGYNSTSKLPVLYLVRLSDGVVLAKLAGNIPTAQTSANGLATPAVTRNANSGRVEYAYAGDYLGQVWKFDLTGLNNTSRPTTPTPTIGTLVFQTRDVTGNYTQPITSPLAVAYSYDATDASFKNKTFVFIGTGSDLTVADAADATIAQSLYGIVDMGPYPVSNSRVNANGNLVQRSFSVVNGTYNNYHGARGIVYARAIAQRAADTPGPPRKSDMENRSGWVLDWPATTTTPQEKVVSAPVVRHSDIPTLAVSSVIPYFQDCNSQGQGWANFLDAYHGDGLVESHIDLNRDGSWKDETVGGAAISSVNFGIGIIGGGGFFGNEFLAQGSSGRAAGLGTSTGSKDGDGKLHDQNIKSGRVAWREIVK